jgi:hypothetical protein
MPEEISASGFIVFSIPKIAQHHTSGRNGAHMVDIPGYKVKDAMGANKAAINLGIFAK